MNEEPAPATAEWPEGADFTPWDMSSRDALMRLSPLHNAALAAERDQNWRNAYDNLLIDYDAEKRANSGLYIESNERKRQLDAAVETADWAWTIMASASGGDWQKESKDWQEAAAKWRDEAWHPLLDKIRESRRTVRSSLWRRGWASVYDRENNGRVRTMSKEPSPATYRLVATQESPNDLRAYELNSEDPCGYMTPIQPAPATAEWTRDWVLRNISGLLPDEAVDRLCNSHNAALAAEREKREEAERHAAEWNEKRDAAVEALEKVQPWLSVSDAKIIDAALAKFATANPSGGGLARGGEIRG